MGACISAANQLPNLLQIQRRGFRMAFGWSVLTHSYESWLPLASFIKFDLSILKAEAMGWGVHRHGPQAIKHQ
jgi:hypothetical protein